MTTATKANTNTTRPRSADAPDPFYRLAGELVRVRAWLRAQLDKIEEANPDHAGLAKYIRAIDESDSNSFADLICRVGEASDNLRVAWLDGELNEVELPRVCIMPGGPIGNYAIDSETFDALVRSLAGLFAFEQGAHQSCPACKARFAERVDLVSHIATEHRDSFITDLAHDLGIVDANAGEG